MTRNRHRSPTRPASDTAIALMLVVVLLVNAAWLGRLIAVLAWGVP